MILTDYQDVLRIAFNTVRKEFFKHGFECEDKPTNGVDNKGHLVFRGEQRNPYWGIRHVIPVTKDGDNLVFDGTTLEFDLMH